MNVSGLGPLSEDSRVVIIGGGPGGTATALALQKEAQAMGRRIAVTIVEGKRFAGEQHHNQCVGVLSSPIVELVENGLGIPFPHHLNRHAITGYVLHGHHNEITLDGETEPSIALRRILFDAYMLEAARQHGIEVIQARLTGLEFHADRVVVYTESKPLQADMVVGAFGLDEGTAVLFQRAVGYHPPPYLSSVVTKFHPGIKGMARFGNRIHAFLPSVRWIEFGAVTPKGNHLTINIAGACVNSHWMDYFLSLAEVCQLLPGIEKARCMAPDSICYFKGSFPCGLARNITGDRFVVMGDAAGLVRAFKGKGVNSAILTGIRAAHVILCEGISAVAFQAYHRANRDILNDLPYGQAMRYITILAARLGLMDDVIRAARRSPELRRALFDAVSAHRPYREVVRRSFAPASLGLIALGLVKGALKR